MSLCWVRDPDLTEGGTALRPLSLGSIGTGPVPSDEGETALEKSVLLCSHRKERVNLFFLPFLLYFFFSFRACLHISLGI